MEALANFMHVDSEQNVQTFIESIKPWDGKPCERCLSTRKDGCFHYLGEQGSLTMFVCPKRSSCTKIVEYHERYVSIVRRHSRMPYELSLKSSTNFIIDKPWQQSVLHKLSKWNVKDKNWILLSGGPGTGKTHLVSAIVNSLLSQGYEVMYARFSEVMDSVRSRDYSLMQACRCVPILFLDDLYKGNITPFELKETADLIDYRGVNKMITLITTEKSPQELIETDQATTGRIIRNCNDFWAVFPRGLTADYRLQDFVRAGQQ